MSKHLFTAKSESGWCTSISISNTDKIIMDSGNGVVATLSIKDIRKIVREYNKAKKNQQLETGGTNSCQN